MGRPKNEVFETPDDQLAHIISKLYDVQFDENGEMKYVRNGNVCTLEEMALIRWYQDGCPEKGPISKMGELKKESKMLHEIKIKLLKSGFTVEELHDMISMLSKAQRKSASCCDRVEEIDY